MAYFADLSPYAYGGEPQPGVVHVGWLDAEHLIPRGPLPPGVLERLRALAKNPVELYRGLHHCERCCDLDCTGLSSEEILHRFRTFDEMPGVRGTGEIRVSGDGLIYAAPVMIVHYIERHDYQPPREFIDAVMRANP